MNISCGIIGSPNVGKSTLFNALLKKQAALVADYPFTTIEPNVGIVPVPDENLDKIQKIEEEELKIPNIPIIPSTVKFVDIAGLVKGAHRGEGLGNKFLSHIREVSVIAHIVRLFDGSAGAKSNPAEDYEIVKMELELGGVESKPEIIVLNVSESEYNQDSINRTCTEYIKLFNLHNNDIVVSCAKIDDELSGFSDEDQKKYLEELGLPYSGVERLIKKAYEALDLISFYTTKGGREVRSWSIPRGETAVRAAGEVHTDFMKKFIKAEVVSFDDFVANSGWKGSRAGGKARLEGKNYIVQDGDVIEFKIGR